MTHQQVGRSSFPVPVTPPQPVKTQPLPGLNLEHGMAEVMACADLGDASASFLAWLFDATPEMRKTLRILGRIGGGLYGVKVVAEKTQDQAALMNFRYGHLNVYGPPAKVEAASYTADMRGKQPGPRPGWKPKKLLLKRRPT